MRTLELAKLVIEGKPEEENASFHGPAADIVNLAQALIDAAEVLKSVGQPATEAWLAKHAS